MRAPRGPYGARVSPHRIFGIGSISLSRRQASQEPLRRQGERRRRRAGRRRPSRSPRAPRRAARRAAPVADPRLGEDRRGARDVRQPGLDHGRTDPDPPRGPGRTARVRQRRSSRAPRSATTRCRRRRSRRDPVRPAGASHPRVAGHARARRAPADAAAVQRDHLQRPRPADGHLQRRRPARGALSAVDHRRRRPASTSR